MRLALVHDYLYVYGGAERTLLEVHREWPDAPVYTLLYVPERLPDDFRRMDVRPTWVDRLPWRLRLQRLYAVLQPLAFGRLRVRGADAVLSFASFGAKAVPAPPGGLHVCYCYTPPRFLWGPASGIDRSRLPRPVRLASAGLDRALRRWDLAAARRVDRFITQSHYVAARIRRVYGRAAAVVYPPVDVARFAAVTPRDEGYLLIVSRFEAYKRIDLAIRACRLAGVPLRIVGAGVDEARLRGIAAETDGPGASAVDFLGPRPDGEVVTLLAGCRAFLHPAAEDFGLTAVEAQAAGRPVIAFAAGGALETVVPGLTGAFFHRPEADALAETIAAFRPGDYDPQIARRNAARFAPAVFRRRLRAAVESALHPGGQEGAPPADDSRRAVRSLRAPAGEPAGGVGPDV